MIRPAALALLLLLIPVLGPGAPAQAGGAFGYSLDHRPDLAFPGKKVLRSPYPATKAAASVWLSDACFRDCTGQAAWRFEACIRGLSPEDCRVRLDADDRICVRACRTRGGPLLNITD